MAAKVLLLLSASFVVALLGATLAWVVSRRRARRVGDREWKARLDEAQRELRDQRRSLAEVEKALFAARIASSSTSGVSASIKEHETALAAARQTVEKLRAELDGQKADATAVRAKLERLQRGLRAMVARHIQQRKELREIAAGERKLLEKMVHEARQATSAQRARADQLERARQGSAAHAEELQRALEEQQRDKAELANVTELLREVSSSLADLRSTVAAAAPRPRLDQQTGEISSGPPTREIASAQESLKRRRGGRRKKQDPT